MAAASVYDRTVEAPSLSPARSPSVAVVRDLPLPADLRKHFPSHGAPISHLSPASSPSYGPLICAGHHPPSSCLSKPFMKRSELIPPISSLKNVAPTYSAAAAIPSGLTQPPLSPSVSSK